MSPRQPRIRRAARAALALALTVAAAVGSPGCVRLQPGLPPAFAAEVPPPVLEPLLRKMEAEGEANWVLNLQALGVAALRHGHRDLARRALDEAILQIEVIYGDSPEARRARSFFYSENSKIFKGDPYERSMTYFYRGVLYLQDGDLENARACFRSAGIMDAFAEDDQFRGDWVLFDYLIGVCEAHLGRRAFADEAVSRARASFASLRAAYPRLNDRSLTPQGRSIAPLRLELWEDLLPVDPQANLLVLVQDGRGPRKVGAGAYGELLGYTPGGGASQSVQVAVDGATLGPAQVTDSVYYQAVTRGGRELDAVLGRQAVFKQATSDIGNVGMVAGTVVALEALDRRDEDLAKLGGAIFAVGLLAAFVSWMTMPEADTRTWTSLPDRLGILQARVPEGLREVAVRWEFPPGVGYGPGPTAVSLVDIPPSGEGLAVVLAFPPPGPFLVVPEPTTTTGQPPEAPAAPETQTFSPTAERTF